MRRFAELQFRKPLYYMRCSARAMIAAQAMTLNWPCVRAVSTSARVRWSSLLFKVVGIALRHRTRAARQEEVACATAAVGVHPVAAQAVPLVRRITGLFAQLALRGRQGSSPGSR